MAAGPAPQAQSGATRPTGRCRAALYARVSTQEQAEHNYSLENQLDKLKAYCALNNYTAADEYVDPGYSGTTDQRPAMGRLLRDAEAGLVDVVVVYKLDRFFRNQRLLWGTLHLLESNGVGLVSVTESFDTTTPVGRAMLGMLGTFAQLERDTFMERSRDGMRKAVSAGKYTGGIVAYGYRLNPETKELEIEPAEADIVRRMYQWAAEGLTTYAIAARLNALDVPTKYVRDGRGIRGKATAGRWWPGRVRNVLVSPTYKGEWQYGKRTASRKDEQRNRPQLLTQGKAPALVDVEIWEKARETLARNATFATRNSRREYLLRGLVRCACGYAYAGAYYDRSDGSEVRYYRCCWRARTNVGDTGCDKPPIQAEFIESLVWQDIKGFLRQPDNVIEALRAMRAREAVDYSGELARVERKLGDLADAEARLLTLYTGAALTRDALDREAARLEQERLSALRVKAEIERDRAGEEAERLKLESLELSLRAMAERLDAPTDEQRRDVVRALVSRILIDKDEDGTPAVRITYAFDGAAGVIGNCTPRGSWHRPVKRATDR